MAALFRLKVKWILIPIELLVSDDLTPAAKFLWIRLRLDEKHRRPRPQASRKLAKRTGLARSTIMLALKKAAATGWLVPSRHPHGKGIRWKTACPVEPAGFVRIPVDLIRDWERVRPQEVLCYGFLQLLPSFNGLTGYFKWAELRQLTGLHLRTLKRAVRALAANYWIGMQQKNRLSPIWYRLQHADEARMNEVQRRLDDRLNRPGGNHIGEAIMHEALALIVATDVCQEGARPEFLRNPATGERMELDRYYPNDRVAFEFNGRQHYAATERFSKDKVMAQRKRDAVKRQICKKYGIKLVVVRAEDLTFVQMLRKVGDLLPRGSLRIFGRTIQYLNKRAVGYQQAALA